MKKERTIQQIAEIERAIEQKYGKEALHDFNSDWDELKEKEYLNQLKSLIQNEQKEKEENKEDYILIKKLIIKQLMVCPICDSILRKSDDVFITKFECCENCYIRFIDGFREHLWKERKKKLLEEKKNKS